MEEKKITNILLVGETGNGKSSLGNLILGWNAFEIYSDPNSCTKDTILKISRNDPNIAVIDTPGLQDSQGRDKEHYDQMLKIIKQVKDIHFILVVLNYQQCRLNNSIKYMLKFLCNVFPIGFINHVGVVFTHYDEEYEVSRAKRANKKIKDNYDPRVSFKEKYIPQVKDLISMETGEKSQIKIPDFFLDSQFLNEEGEIIEKDENTNNEIALIIATAKSKEEPVKKIEEKSDIRYKKEEIEYETRETSEQIGNKIVTKKQKYKTKKFTDYNGKISYGKWEKEGNPVVTEKEVEKEYITIFQEKDDDFEEENNRSLYLLNKSYYSSVHEHPLLFLDKSEDNGWACDGRKLIDKCFSGISDFSQTKGIPRFRCRQCDFDLCDKCMNHYKIIYEINKHYKTKVHPHSLVCLGKSEVDNWLCDGKNLVGGCLSGITGFFQTKGVERFRCKECDFDLCRYCMDSYLERNKGCVIF